MSKFGSRTILEKCAPIGLIDVGASGGMEKEWRSLLPYVSVVGFEPDKNEYNKLLISDKHKSNIYINSAVSDSEGTKVLFVRKGQGNTSFYDTNSSITDKLPYNDRFEVVNKVEVHTDTLDSLLKSNDIDDMDFLKIDVEGAELDVIKGAEFTITKEVFCIQVEVRFIDVYKDAPLFAEIHEKLSELGFDLFDLNRYYYKKKIGLRHLKGQLGMGDALYLINLEKFISRINQLNDKNTKKRKVLKGMGLSSLYGYLDYAVELLERNRILFSDEEYDDLMSNLITKGSFAEAIPHFKGKGFIYRLFKSIGDLFLSSYQGAFHSDGILGNRKL